MSLLCPLISIAKNKEMDLGNFQGPSKASSLQREGGIHVP